jgi:tetratricopeptide (TPR) repeat protein
MVAMRCRVSLCMIVCNEEANLPACLHSAADLVDETIVVDTGSTDHTKDVARALGARIHDFTWIDSFAAARNESLKHATGDWIFWLDADDRIDDGNRTKLASLFAGLKEENAAYVMKSRSQLQSSKKSLIVAEHLRLFRNHPQIRWQYRVHEQIGPAVIGQDGQLRATDIVIDHAGYRERAWQAAKYERNLRLLRQDLAERPDDADVLFYLGWTHLALDRPTEALPWLRRSLAGWHPARASACKVYTVIVQCLLKLGQKGEALTLCLEGRARYPDDADLLHQEAMLRSESGDVCGSEACLLQLIDMLPEIKSTVATATGLDGNLLRRKLARIYFSQRRFADAEVQWRAILATQPTFMEAWMGLADGWLAQGLLPELEQTASMLTKQPDNYVAGSVLAARLHLARREFAVAEELLEQTIMRAPRAIYPRLVLGDVLLQEGRDLAGAEKAWRDLLSLHPNCKPAQQRLIMLSEPQ